MEFRGVLEQFIDVQVELLIEIFHYELLHSRDESGVAEDVEASPGNAIDVFVPFVADEL